MTEWRAVARLKRKVQRSCGRWQREIETPMINHGARVAPSNGNRQGWTDER